MAAVLDRAADRHGGDLVVIEGAGTGAERAAHRWCQERGLPAWRHRCHPRLQASRGLMRLPRETLAVRHQRILREEGPRLVVVFHETFTPGPGTSADIARRAVAAGVPVWLVPGADPGRGRWLTAADLPGPPPAPSAVSPGAAVRGGAPDGSAGPTRPAGAPATPC
ncbi:hypothetical protein GCM10010405_54450 [Streptomyces macrosporus]|uniref:YspA cpYpsA-related SLOG domain-containing protein n=1 Tax=Streptomyces macrosporus TaxID=44032 RepID=A0ABN3KP87_9ACTN